MQLGHQAINCTNGTINWKQIYGEESFKLKTPTYPSEYDAVAKAKQVDVDKLKKLAEEWKNVCPTLCNPPAHHMACMSLPWPLNVCHGRVCRKHLHAALELQKRQQCCLSCASRATLRNRMSVHAVSCQCNHASSWRPCEDSPW